MEFLSNPELIFAHSSQKVVNYEDPNLNIGLPIFSIHGNHDNPSMKLLLLFGLCRFIRQRFVNLLDVLLQALSQLGQWIF